MENPYSTPEADVEVKSTKGDFSKFPRFSTFLVFLINAITQGIYGAYWMFNRTGILNQSNPKNPLSMNLVYACLALLVVVIVLSVGIDPRSIDPGIFFPLFMATIIAYLVFFLMWAFGFRKRLHEMTGAKPGDNIWCNGFLTFLFNILYLNYKINQIKDVKG